MMQVFFLMALCCSVSIACLPNRATEELFDFLDQMNQENNTISATMAKRRIEELINRGAHINSHNKQNRTPLMLIAQSPISHVAEVIEFVVKQGADVNARDQHRRTALEYSLHRPYPSGIDEMQKIDEMIETTKKLVELGSKVTIHDLFSAIWLEKQFELLLPYYHNLQERGYAGNSLLHLAVSLSLKSTKLLVDHHVDVHIRNTKNGKSVLHSVLRPQVDVRYDDETDEDRVTKKKAMIKYLMDKGLTLSVEDNHGKTLLHELIEGHLKDGVKIPLLGFLVEHNVDPLKKDHDGLSALHYAMHRGEEDIIDAFMDAIRKYQSHNVVAALADLDNDSGDIKLALEKRNRVMKIASTIGDWVVINGLAIYGGYKGIMMLRKIKLH